MVPNGQGSRTAKAGAESVLGVHPFLRLDGAGPIYLQLYRSLRTAIVEGRLGPGAKLPPTRSLARALGISRNVVLLAFEQLGDEGYVHGRVGAGTFVSPDLPDSLREANRSEARPPLVAGRTVRLATYAERLLELDPQRGVRRHQPVPGIDFYYGHVPLDERARGEWRRLVHRAATHLSGDYAPAQGLPRLREAVAELMGRTRGVRCRADQVLIVNGSQQALDLAARVLLDPGDTVALEDPHYQGARQAFQATGAVLRAIPVDDDGLRVEELPEDDGVRAVFVTPSHQFPTGAVMPFARRLALLEWAERNDAWIFEDDYDSEHRYRGRPLEAVQGLDRHGRAIYIGTFSRALFPGLRLGYLVLPEDLVEPFVAAKWIADRHSPTLDQFVLAAFLAEGHLERHLRRTRQRHAEQRAALLAALEKHFGDAVRVQGRDAGLHVLAWLEGLPAHAAPALVRAALERGVGLYPVDPYYLEQPPGLGLLLGFGSVKVERIDEGVRRLAECRHQLQGASWTRAPSLG